MEDNKSITSSHGDSLPLSMGYGQVEVHRTPLRPFFCRNNAFEVRTVDSKSSGIIHCEDANALEQWIKHLENNINTLNKKSIKMSNKYLHPSEHVSRLETTTLFRSAILDGSKSECPTDTSKTRSYGGNKDSSFSKARIYAFSNHLPYFLIALFEFFSSIPKS